VSDHRGESVDNRLVAVCSECLRASCWQGALVCSEAGWATMMQKSVSELRRLAYEDPSYWDVFEHEDD
jgi:hypothetical protein